MNADNSTRRTVAMSSAAHLYRDKPHFLFAILMTIWLSLFLMRFWAPSDLLDKDQERPAAYMADAALNGNWIVQVDDHGKVCSKPPVYTWIGAALILLAGRINDFALYFPSALGVLGCSLLMWRFGSRHFGVHAAFLGACFLLLSGMGIRILYLARTDAMFGFATFLTACLGYRAWRQGHGWIWFWLGATLATLTKGPLGVVLTAGGLLGLLREPRAGISHAGPWRAHVMGMMVFLVITLGWLWLAYTQRGDAVMAKLIGRELYGHTDWSSQRFSPGLFFFAVPSLYFVSRFFPWSLPAVYGLWRLWKHPAPDYSERCFERFLAAYLCFGILLFSVFPHQRPDHLFPLLPAAGLLAGREVARWFGGSNRMARMIPYTIVLWFLVLVGFGIYYYKIDPANNSWFEKTAGVRQLAQRYEAAYGTRHDLFFVDVPYGLQYYLNTMRQRISYTDAARMLASQQEVLLAVHDIGQFRTFLGPEVPLYVLMQWPEGGKGFIQIVSNRLVQPEHDR
jgi:4-amino-4-deoxy-L-arabinose transferase-like glycosyltransferase